MAARVAQRMVAALAAIVLLASCWLPDKFEVEIRFTSTGAYGITYIGNLIYAPLWGQTARGEITPEAAETQNQQFLAFLKQDSSFKSVNPLGRGRYQVEYRKEDQFAGAHQSFNFVNRQGAIFRLRTTEDGLVTLAGSGQAKLYAQRFEEVGLSMEGLVRVTTDAEVLEHNATFVRASPVPGFTQYDWRLRSLRDDPPRLVAKLKIDPRTGVPLFGGLSGAVQSDE
ncbi:MAG: hypothetical protein SFV21_07490 [Rhodospirillaceae bacterium]|nr:hypothetical protein [Rhodospirillaceae bacterium]